MEEHFKSAKKFKNESLWISILLWTSCVLFYIMPKREGAELPLILPVGALIITIIYLNMRTIVNTLRKEMERDE